MQNTNYSNFPVQDLSISFKQAFLSEERKPWERKLFASRKEAFFACEAFFASLLLKHRKATAFLVSYPVGHSGLLGNCSASLFVCA